MPLWGTIRISLFYDIVGRIRGFIMLLDQHLDVIDCSTALEVKLLAALIRERRARQLVEAKLSAVTRRNMQPASIPVASEPVERDGPAPGFINRRLAELPARSVNITQIQKAVCQHWRVSLGEIKSDIRGGRVLAARQVAYLLARVLTRHTFPMIGRMFGGKDHSTVIHTCDRLNWLRLKLESVITRDNSLEAWVREASERYELGKGLPHETTEGVTHEASVHAPLGG